MPDVTLTTCLNTEQQFQNWLQLKLKAKKAKAQVLGIAPLNMRFTIVEVVTDQHWL